MPDTLPPSFYDAAMAILQTLGAPPTPVNINLLAAWEWCEKIHTQDGAWQWNNPLNTTQQEPGSYSVNSSGVQAYPSQQVGVQATVETLRNGYYPHLLAGIMNGDAATFFGAPGEMATWGTNLFCIQQVYAQLGPPPVSLGAQPQPQPSITLGAFVSSAWPLLAIGAAALAIGVWGLTEVEPSLSQRVHQEWQRLV